MLSPRQNDTNSTMVDLLRWRAEHQAHARAYTFLVDGEETGASLSYADLDRRARTIGAWLQAEGMAGERVLLLYPPSLDYIAAFFGCLYAGALAVPSYLPRANRPDSRLQAIIEDSQATIALTTTPVLDTLSSALRHTPNLERVTLIATDRLDENQASAWHQPLITPASTAFLQYTSGSTAVPKGVMVSHANLMHNLGIIQRANEHSSESRGVIWLPPYHDMGLIGGILQPLYLGCEVVLMPPMAFLQRPIRWLRAISRYRATTSGGPNFAYELCLQKITPEERADLDLSSWNVAFSGAEPVRADTLERFAAAFEPCGFRWDAFYPCYGLAEATLMVAGGMVGEPPIVRDFSGAALERHQVQAAPEGPEDAKRLVSCGKKLGALEVRIVDPQALTTCPPDRVGEIWVAGESVAAGYWNRAEETEHTFRARLSNGDAGPFLRTGDLGFFHDGELFVAGRLKDLIIVRGRNHYPQDIELTVERSHPMLRQGGAAAFSVDIDGEERLVVVQEVERQARHTIDAEQIARSIRQAVAEEHEVQIHAVALIKPGGIPKTSSGKIQRQLCREKFLTQRLETIGISVTESTNLVEQKPTRQDLLGIAPEQRRSQIERYLRQSLAEITRMSIDQVTIDHPLHSLGLDSLMAVELQHRIEVDLGIVLPMAGLLEGAPLRHLVDQIHDKLAEPLRTPPPAISQEKAETPLSQNQQSLWFQHQLVPEKAVYNIARALRVRSTLDVAALRQACQRLVDRHPALRTNFPAYHGQPVQRIHTEADVFFRVEDATYWTSDMLDSRLAEAAQAPFDLEHDRLLRIYVFSQSARSHVLLLVVHHLVVDFWSLAMLARELGKLYQAEITGIPAYLGTPSLDYTSYVAWQSNLVAGADGERLLAYWRDQLAGKLPVLNLPTDRPRPRYQAYRGATRDAMLDQELTHRLRSLSRDAGTTLYTTLLAAFQTLLYRYTGQSDILVGTPTTGRSRADFGDIVGYFINTVVLRASLSDDLTFTELLKRTRQTVLDAFAHQDYPFALLTKQLQPTRDPAFPPVFQVLFVWEQAPWHESAAFNAFSLGKAGARLQLGGLALEMVALPQQAVQYDLVLQMAEVSDELGMVVFFNTDLFEMATIERLIGHFQTLLSSIVAHPDQHLLDLSLLTDREQRQLILDWNDTRVEADLPPVIHAWFERQAQRQPNAAALAFRDDTLTYGELNRRANKLAHYLIGLGVGAEMLVGICVQRSPDMLVAILATLKAGGAYVPLDPTYPRERLRYILADTRARIVLTNQQAAASLVGLDAKLVYLDDDWPAIEVESDRDPAGRADGPHLAYVIYTSGSTGQPKGVQVTHQNLVYSTHARFAYYTEPVASYLLLPSFAFDSSVAGIFWTLSQGGMLVLPEELYHLDMAALATLLSRWRVSHLLAVPSLYRVILDHVDQASAPALRAVIVAGESCPGDLVRRHSDRMWHAELFNEYGPTEGTVWCSVYRCDPDKQSALVPIGVPIANARLYLLDRSLRPVPVGVIGELYVGGPGVARGYLNRPDLTAARFLPNPFPEYGERQTKEALAGDGSLPSSERLYRTGDLARYLSDGNIEFLGRADQQVKLRGFRIELGEIEAQLRQHAAVRDCVALIREMGLDQKRLVAYVVPETLDGDPGATDATGERVAQFQALYDALYRDEQLFSATDSLINLQVWTDSYTNRPLAESEIRESVDGTVERILSLQPKRVLEIGCGTGLLLSRIAPSCDYYCGTDISAEALQRLREYLNTQHVSGAEIVLLQRAAHDLDEVEPNSVDVVIINEVVQHFPDLSYLVSVIEHAVRLLRPGGCVFLGGLLNYKLSQVFQATLLLPQAPPSMPRAELWQRVQRQALAHKDLAIDPEFFAALQARIAGIGQVRVQLKGGRHHNEMTKFKYDVILRRAAEQATAKDGADSDDWIHWEQQMSVAAVRRYLTERAPTRLSVRDIPNARLLGDVHLLRLLSSPDGPATAADLREASQKEQHVSRGAGIEPDAWWSSAADLPYTVAVRWGGSGALDTYDVIFERSDQSRGAVFQTEAPQTGPGEDSAQSWERYSNKPWRARTERQQIVPALQAYLREHVPDYMVPSIFVILDAFPLSPNGKIDFQALPDPSPRRPLSRTGFVAPRTELERLMATIWQEVLQIDQVGLHDNFFDLGGDSIVSIQVVSRLNQYGLSISPQHMFQHQTIAELAEIATDLAPDRAESYEPVSGPAALTPIQAWFFAQDLEPLHRFAQTVTLSAEQTIDVRALAAALQALLDHHDALRMRYTRQPTGWAQYNGALGETFRLDIVDLSEHEQVEANHALQAERARVVVGLDIERGPLFRAALFRANGRALLLLACHHLVVDAVSWRIIIEDLERGYVQALRGQPIKLASKTLSFLEWGNRLDERVRAGKWAGDAGYWQTVLSRSSPALPEDAAPGAEAADGLARVVVQIDRDMTGMLLRDAHHAYRTSANDLLIAALARALQQQSGRDQVSFSLESHGRNDAVEEATVTRTVGWFTSLYPVALTIDPAEDLGRQLKRVKEHLRRIPAGGASFGALAYLSRGALPHYDLRGATLPALQFNYLGQVADLQTGLFQVVEYGGQPLPGFSATAHTIEINAAVRHGQLGVEVWFNRSHYTQASIERFARSYQAALEEIVAHCMAPEHHGLTPSDVPLIAATQDEIDGLRDALGRSRPGHPAIEDIYPLSPMQQSMLLYALAAPESAVSFEQFRFTIDGFLDKQHFEQAWNATIAHHSTLRTIFDWQSFSQPVQIVLGELPSPVVWRDLRHSEAQIQQNEIDAYIAADRARSFDFDRGPLIRMSVLQEAERAWVCVLSLHHIISDGWSFMLLMENLFGYYGALRRQSNPPPTHPRRYRDYIAWLGQQDRARSLAFWRMMLEGFATPTPLPLGRHPGASPERKIAEHTLAVSGALSASLADFSAARRLTLNTLIQAMWSILLWQYSHQRDIVFGVAVSGRPASIAGVERILGLFINNLPMRVRVEDGKTVLDFLSDLQDLSLAMRDYEYTFLPDIQACSAVPASKKLFNSLIVFQNYPLSEKSMAALPEIAIRDLSIAEMTNFDLTLTVFNTNTLQIRVQYDEGSVEQATIARVASHMEKLLALIVAHPDASLAELRAAAGDTPDLARASFDVARTASKPALIHRARGGAEQMVAMVWQEILEVDEIDVEASFLHMGASSLTIVAAHARLQEKLGRAFPLVMMFKHPTVRSLAAYLSEPQEQVDTLDRAYEDAREHKALATRHRKLMKARTQK